MIIFTRSSILTMFFLLFYFHFIWVIGLKRPTHVTIVDALDCPWQREWKVERMHPWPTRRVSGHHRSSSLNSHTLPLPQSHLAAARPFPPSASPSPRSGRSKFPRTRSYPLAPAWVAQGAELSHLYQISTPWWFTGRTLTNHPSRRLVGYQIRRSHLWLFIYWGGRRRRRRLARDSDQQQPIRRPAGHGGGRRAHESSGQGTANLLSIGLRRIGA
jgi:hypothetical protein